jgi:CarD family transcriptional regulator
MVSAVGDSRLVPRTPQLLSHPTLCGPAARQAMVGPKGVRAAEFVETLSNVRGGRRKRFEMMRMDNDMTAQKKKVPANSNTRKHDFKANDHVVYPTHGVGRIARVEEQEVAGTKLELFVITFEKDKMTLRVPTAKAKAVGMRKLSSPDVVATALNTLKGRARIKRTMWSRRAQEYEAKINSGDLVSIAEVVRDLHRASGQPEQSYSERQLYEAALARMAREVAAVERIDEQAAVKRVETVLLKKAA